MPTTVVREIGSLVVQGTRRYFRISPLRGLLDGDDLHGSDFGVGGKQLGGGAGERLRDLAIQVGLAAVLVLKRVEDAVRRLADLERVPGHRALFGYGERAAVLEKLAELASLLGLGLEQGEHTESHGHIGPSVAGVDS